MPSTYQIISSTTLSTTATTFTFSAIPNTFTDLVITASVRDNAAFNGFSFRTSFNSDSSTNYSFTELWSRGTTVTSGRASDTAGRTDFYAVNGNSDTANCFGNAEIYIPSYLVSQSKPMGGAGVAENNSATGNTNAVTANLWRNTAAITSITFTALSTFVAGSSFYLYGIKNS
jgi:hypothetical protein